MNLSELKQKAEAATPGPWEWWTSCSFNRLSSVVTGKDGDVLYAVKYRDGVAGIEGRQEDMAFIAAANPAEVLRLVRIAEAAKAAHDFFVGYCNMPEHVQDRVVEQQRAVMSALREALEGVDAAAIRGEQNGEGR